MWQARISAKYTNSLVTTTLVLGKSCVDSVNNDIKKFALVKEFILRFLKVRNGNLLKSCVRIRIKRIRVNQGVDIVNYVVI